MTSNLQFILSVDTASGKSSIVEFEEHLRRLNKTAKDAGAGGSKAMGAFGDTLKTALMAGIGLGSGLSVVRVAQTLGEWTAAAVMTGLSFDALKEQAQMAFTTMLGSGSKAKMFLDDLQDFANRTPFEFPGLVTAAQRLMAMGFAAKEVRPLLTAVGDAASGLGRGQDTIDRITLALGQMRGRGKIVTQEMNQMTEAGIPAWDILATKMHLTRQALQQLVEKGAVPAKKAIDMLVDGMNDRFGGMMNKQSKTMNGLISTVKDMGRAITGQLVAGGFDLLKGSIDRTVRVMDQFNDNLKGMPSRIQAAMPSVGTMTAAFEELAQAIALSRPGGVFIPTTGQQRAGIIASQDEGIAKLAKDFSMSLADVNEALGILMQNPAMTMEKAIGQFRTMKENPKFGGMPDAAALTKLQDSLTPKVPDPKDATAGNTRSVKRVQDALTEERAIIDARAAAATATMTLLSAQNQGIIGLEQDQWAAIEGIDTDAENRSYAALQESFAKRKVLATALGKIGPAEKRASLAALEDFDSEEKVGATNHAATLAAIHSKAAEAQAGFVADAYVQIEQLGLAHVASELRLLEAEKTAKAAARAADYQGNLNIASATIQADAEFAKARVGNAADTAKLLNLSASEQVALTRAYALEKLNIEERAIRDLYAAKVTALAAERAAELQSYNDGFINYQAYMASMARLDAEASVLRIENAGELHGIDSEREGADIAAQQATLDRQNALVDGIAGNISKMFTDRMTNSNVSFWQSFKKLGTDAAASLASTFLNSLIKGFLSPFKKVLDDIVQGIAGSFSKMLTGGGGEGGGGGGLINSLGGGLFKSITGGGGSGGGGGILANLGTLWHGASPVAGTLAKGAIGTINPATGALVTGTQAGAAGGLSGALGLGGGAGLFGLGAATIPVVGGIIAGAAIGFHFLKKSLNRPFQAAAQAGVDPWEKQKDRTMWFNSTFPFEKMAATLTALDKTLGGVDETLSSVSTQDPGVMMLNNFPAIKDPVKDAVVEGVSTDRKYRRNLSGAILDTPL